MLYEKGANASLKRIDTGQPARTAQADLGRYFSAPGHVFASQRKASLMVRLFGSRIIRYLAILGNPGVPHSDTLTHSDTLYALRVS